jgi:hypothetical protein
MRSSILLAALFTAAAIPPLSAADCGAEVDQLASRYRVAVGLPQGAPPTDTKAEVPATTESRGIPPEAMKESGGVIAPPDQGGRMPTIEPPQQGSGAMPTTPNIPPQTAQRPTARSNEMSAAKRTQLQSILTAAKAAAGQQREQECFQQLSQARALTESDLQ